MKTQLILITGVLSITGILYGATQKESNPEVGASRVIITNRTGYKLKVTLQSKEDSKEKEIYFTIPSEATEDDAIKFSKTGIFMGYKGSKFFVEIVNQRMGVHTDNWAGEFTGKDASFSHTFEYRAVVQNPVKIMSTVNLKMIVSYRIDAMNIVFSAPQEELDN